METYLGNGESRCQNCFKNAHVCHYPPVSAKIVVEENWVERLQGRCCALERALMEAIPDQEKRKELAAHYGLRLMVSGSPSERSESEPSSGGSNDPILENETHGSGGYGADAYSMLESSQSIGIY